MDGLPAGPDCVLLPRAEGNFEEVAVKKESAVEEMSWSGGCGGFGRRQNPDGSLRCLSGQSHEGGNGAFEAGFFVGEDAATEWDELLCEVVEFSEDHDPEDPGDERGDQRGDERQMEEQAPKPERPVPAVVYPFPYPGVVPVLSGNPMLSWSRLTSRRSTGELEVPERVAEDDVRPPKNLSGGETPIPRLPETRIRLPETPMQRLPETPMQRLSGGAETPRGETAKNRRREPGRGERGAVGEFRVTANGGRDEGSFGGSERSNEESLVRRSCWSRSTTVQEEDL